MVNSFFPSSILVLGRETDSEVHSSQKLAGAGQPDDKRGRMMRSNMEVMAISDAMRVQFPASNPGSKAEGTTVIGSIRLKKKEEQGKKEKEKTQNSEPTCLHDVNLPKLHFARDAMRPI